ncbi:MAG: 50S ribosomal protein L21 [Candidatus Zambryskibacteria bacterium]|nr:50S ribosomal protein L21 [Candidatus Zambryskibacteria bacterium]
MTEATIVPTSPKATKGKVKSRTKKAAPKAKAKKHEGKTLFAVFAAGGKQYRVSEGDIVKVEKIPGNHKEGDSITFDNVLMTDNGASEITLGNPFIKGSSVSATLNKISRYKTIDVIKYKQKSRYFKKYGHRQPYFEVRIDSIK